MAEPQGSSADPSDADVDPLAGFSAATRAWFEGAFQRPTPAQQGAWRAIASGRDALVVAPTGSGKTLAAFLWSLDRLAAEPPPAEPRQRCRVLYVSPLKALAVDVERNLRSPLTGIRQAAQRLGLAQPDVTVSIRTGDTPAGERRQFLTKPSDILITTPESLFLILTSQARDSLRGVEAVIVDEVHAVAGTKRGAHLALSLERLDALLDKPARRIGLSATVRPVDEVARWLAGTRDVEIVQPPSTKVFDIQVVVPVEDMAEMGTSTGEVNGSAAAEPERASIWPHVEERVLDLIETHRSTIVFANSRRLAERLCARLNELHLERVSGRTPDPTSHRRRSWRRAGSPTVPRPRSPAPTTAASAASSDGSSRRTSRPDACPRWWRPAASSSASTWAPSTSSSRSSRRRRVASGLQRVGRGGHQVGAVSKGVIFPKYRGDLVQTAVVAESMRAGAIEALSVPRNPLDVLAQQVVAMVAMDPWPVDDLLTLVRRAAPFASLPQSAYDAVLDMLAGRYPSDAFAELRPRIVWDRVTGELTARPGAQRLAVTSGGTIPDRGLFGVFLVGEQPVAGRRARRGDGLRVEARRRLHARLDVLADRGHHPRSGARLPGTRVIPGGCRSGRATPSVGRWSSARRSVRSSARSAALDDDAARERVQAAGLDPVGGRQPDSATSRSSTRRPVTCPTTARSWSSGSATSSATGGWSSTRPSAPSCTPRGRSRSPPGSGSGTASTSRRCTPTTASCCGCRRATCSTTPTRPSRAWSRSSPPRWSRWSPPRSAARRCSPAGSASAPARALLLPRRRPDRRTPLWQQRQRAAQLLSVASEYGSFPIVLETMRECLQDVFDVPGLTDLMRDLESREVRLVEVETDRSRARSPSRCSSATSPQFLYEGDSPLAERRAAALALDTGLLAELLGQAELRELLDETALAAVEADLQRLSEGRRARDVEEAADLLRILGPLSTERGSGARGRARRGWSSSRACDERSAYALQATSAGRPSRTPAGCATRSALRCPSASPRRSSSRSPTRWPTWSPATPARTGRSPRARWRSASDSAPQSCSARCTGSPASGRVVEGELRPGGSGSEWCDAEVLRLLRRRSLAALRQEAEPVPTVALARFLPAWQNVGSPLRGVDGVLRVVEQLQGAPLPASALERLVLPARVRDYQPALLDELTTAGEVLWCGHGSLPGDRRLDLVCTSPRTHR